MKVKIAILLGSILIFVITTITMNEVNLARANVDGNNALIAKAVYQIDYGFQLKRYNMVIENVYVLIEHERNFQCIDTLDKINDEIISGKKFLAKKQWWRYKYYCVNYLKEKS